jgi:hypothetical protein
MARPITDQQDIILARGASVFLKVEVFVPGSGDGTGWIDLGDIDGHDFIRSATWSDDTESQAGQFEVVLVKNDGHLSTAPLVTNSKLNNLTGSMSPLLVEGRQLRISVWCRPQGTQCTSWDRLVSANWLQVFQGRIDVISVGNDDVTLRGRDGIGYLQDTFYEDSWAVDIGGYLGNSGSMELAISNVLADVDSGAELYVPVSPGFTLDPFRAPSASAFQIIEDIIVLVGWELKYRYVDAGMTGTVYLNGSVVASPTAGWKYVLRDPRVTVDPDWLFSRDFYQEIGQHETDLTQVRNAISIVFEYPVYESRIKFTPHVGQPAIKAGMVLDAQLNGWNRASNLIVSSVGDGYIVVWGYSGTVNTNDELRYSPATQVSPAATATGPISGGQLPVNNTAIIAQLYSSTIPLVMFARYWDGTRYVNRATGLTVTSVGSGYVNVTGYSGSVNSGDEICYWSTVNRPPLAYAAASLEVVKSGGAPGRVDVSDSASITKYGRRWARHDEPRVNSGEAATTLANNILADISKAWLTKDITLPFHPYVELGDYIVLEESRDFETASQELYVTGIEHTLSAGEVHTTLTLAGAPTVGTDRWFRREVPTSRGYTTTEPPSPPRVDITPSPGGGTITITPTGPGWNPGRYDIFVDDPNDPNYPPSKPDKKIITITPDPVDPDKEKDTGGVPAPVIANISGLVPGLQTSMRVVAVSSEGVEADPVTVSFTPSRAKVGLLDSGSTPSHLPLNGNFEHASASGGIAVSPPDHWTIIPIFGSDSSETNAWGDGESVWYGTDADKGNYLHFSSGDDGSRGAIESSPFEVRRGLESINIYISARKSGSSNTENECLTLEVSGYSSIGGSALFTNRKYIDASAAGLCPTANTWYDLQFQLADLGWSSNLPDNCNFLQVRLYRGIPTEDNFGGITWDVGDVYVQEAGFFAIEAWSVTADGVQAETLTADTISGFPDITQTSWFAVTFENSFENFGSGWVECKYMKDSMGFIHVRGLAKRASAATNTTIFTLPAGYRPASGCMFACVGNGSHIRIDVGTDGTFKVQAASDANWNNFISFDGITFDTR